MIAISSLLLVVAISLVVTRVATVVLVATGLSRQVARFQARSALTGAGFTTGESEAIVNHPGRRKVVMTLMLLGNVGLVASAGSLIIGFSNSSGIGRQWVRVLELVLGLLVLVVVSRSAAVDRCLTRLAARFVGRHSDVADRDLGGLLQLHGTYSVQELAVRAGEWLAGRTLAELGLRDEGVVVLGLTRADGRYVGAPVGATEVCAGDLLVVYARDEVLRELDRRSRGSEGDRAHRRAVARQAQEEVTERAAEGGDGPPGDHRPAQ